METVFRRTAIEVKTFLQLADFMSTGPVCGFLEKLHIEFSNRKLFAFVFKIWRKIFKFVLFEYATLWSDAGYLASFCVFKKEKLVKMYAYLSKEM